MSQGQKEGSSKLLLLVNILMVLGLLLTCVFGTQKDETPDGSTSSAAEEVAQ